MEQDRRHYFIIYFINKLLTEMQPKQPLSSQKYNNICDKIIGRRKTCKSES